MNEKRRSDLVQRKRKEKKEESEETRLLDVTSLGESRSVERKRTLRQELRFGKRVPSLDINLRDEYGEVA